MKIREMSSIDSEISQIIAPLQTEIAWEVESLLLKIFEYGDYSFRSALSGEYSQTLECVFFQAKNGDNLVGAAGCLYSKNNSAISIVGPVGVLQEYRSQGIGTKLIKSIIEHLKQNNCMATYLGVNNNNPAVKLYSTLGFKQYLGIVRRLLLCEQDEFDNVYFNCNTNVKVREAVWGDFPGFQALITEPGYMYSVNYTKHIFSSKYVEPVRFLSIFPEIMKGNNKYGGLLNVLVAGEKDNIVGFANISRVPGTAQGHIAELEYFVHDNFIKYSELLLNTTLQNISSIEKTNCFCLSCDHIKRDVIEAIGGKLTAKLTKNVFINDSYEDVLIYELRNNDEYTAM